MPVISIIVPTYNTGQFLPTCLNQIVQQTFTDFECILIDDGSTDNSGALCDKIASNDSRFKVVHQANQGLSATRNKGLELAQGEYVCFCDSDDWYHPQYLEFLYSAAIKYHEAAFVMGNRIKVEEYVEPVLYHESPTVQLMTHTDIYREMFNSFQYAGVNCKLYKLAAISSIRFRDTAVEDIDFNMRLYKRVKEFVVVPLNIYYYYQRAGSIIHPKEIAPRYASEIDGWRNLYNDYFKDESEENRSFILQRIFKLIVTRFSRAASNPVVQEKIGRLLDDTLDSFKSNPFIPKGMKFICLMGIKYPALDSLITKAYSYYYRLKH